MLRIGVDTSPISPQMAGVGNYIFYLLEALIEQRKEDLFFLYTHRDLSTLAHFRKFPNVKIRQSSALSRSEALWSQTTLAWMCRQDRLDCFWGGTQSIPFLLHKKTKSLITINDFAYRLYPETVSRYRGLYLRACGKKMYAKADKRLSISQGTADRLKTIYGLSSHAVVHPPLKTSLKVWPKEALIPWLEQQQLRYNDYLVVLGTLEPRKNVLGTLEAYLSILEKEGEAETLPLLVIGGKGWNDHEIQKKIEEAQRKYPFHLRFLGYLQDDVVCKYVSGARYFVMLSFYEGYGMPLAEARRCNTPVICLDVPEMWEAAEGDAIRCTLRNLSNQLSPLFKRGTVSEKAPIRTAYLSNHALASILSTHINDACLRD